MIRNISRHQQHKHLIIFFWLISLLLGVHALPAFSAENQADVEEGGQVMQGFTELNLQKDKIKGMSDKKKHIVLFSMGISLVILILTTAGLGLAMVLYRKPVFVAHMIFAGMSVTLALVHALAAMIWFFPF